VGKIILGAFLFLSSDSRATFTDNTSIHGDVKPDNVLVVHGRFKLADFGFAMFKRKADESKPLRLEGGTLTFGMNTLAQVQCFKRL
jgi:serine/threonine protein kinase